MEKPANCIICLDPLHDEPALSCGHWLHHSCVRKHFKPECPICRRKLDVEVTGCVPEPYVPFSADGDEGMTNDAAVVLTRLARMTRPPRRGTIHVSSEEALSWLVGEQVRQAEHYSHLADGYIHAEESPDYDEENPHGDDFGYEDY